MVSFHPLHALYVSLYNACSDEGKVYVWGSNRHLELGPFVCDNWPVPLCLSDIEERGSGDLFSRAVSHVAAGGNTTLALTNTGLAAIWGTGEKGKLGLGGSGSLSRVPRALESLRTECVVSISSGWQHAGAVTSDGSLFMWGCSDQFQCGMGNQLDHYTPTKGCLMLFILPSKITHHILLL